ncbi:FAD-dependent monooxygenase [Thermomonospora umbrina]|uniref:Bifunctional hydroxylase/dehydrase n=1 Tax=Thermomonospora umbrina TaxID=111806 RepID=A0A3D9SYA9_9ACTN|nr:FAD-dependent monooxygenase [Thermomonospora umbrina]REF00940.1 bifunctional hydroxylase/dehydrase [Thermomonospora umbrina]
MDAAVIVVGAGPTGLMLAAELRLGGAEVIVLDRLAEPTGESRGLGFTARTVELFDQRGLLERFGEVETSPMGHFGGVPLDYSVLPGGHFGARSIAQGRVEAMLTGWATELGADLRRGWDVTGLTDAGDHVEVTADTPDGPRTLRARFLVGCDGGRSTIRPLAGFEFPGTDATIEMFLADVVGCDLEARQIGEKVPGGMVMSAPLKDGVDRIIVCERGTPPRRRTEPPTFEEVAAAWERLTGQDISGGTATWVSSFGDATRQVTEYRRGSVLLAGDAAHIHLPAGGQGLSTGVQDAVNLGWKLAATVNGRAPAGLLDSYHTERHPVGERLLMNTQTQGYLYLSGSEVEPLRGVFAELMGLPEVGRHLAGMVSHLAVRYDVGEGDHPLLGRRVPNAELVGRAGDVGKTSVVELLHAGRGVLLDLADDAAVRDAAAGWSDRVDIVTASPHGTDPGPYDTTTALLIRPDGHTAWAAPGADGPAEALGRWFGAPHRPDPVRK